VRFEIDKAEVEDPGRKRGKCYSGDVCCCGKPGTGIINIDCLAGTETDERGNRLCGIRTCDRVNVEPGLERVVCRIGEIDRIAGPVEDGNDRMPRDVFEAEVRYHVRGFLEKSKEAKRYRQDNYGNCQKQTDQKEFIGKFAYPRIPPFHSAPVFSSYAH
jgi:hypothetical protein